MTIKEQIMESIKSNPTLYEDKEGSFLNVIIPAIEKSTEKSILEDMVCMLAAQCKAYDILLDNISNFGNNILIKKCNIDLKALFLPEE